MSGLVSPDGFPRTRVQELVRRLAAACHAAPDEDFVGLLRQLVKELAKDDEPTKAPHPGSTEDRTREPQTEASEPADEDIFGDLDQ